MFRKLVTKVGRAIGVKRPIMSVSPGLGYCGCRLVGLFVGDVVITREEIRGLMEGRLYVDAPCLGGYEIDRLDSPSRGCSRTPLYE